jgi:transcriptional regulator with XRE-family HTH domain
MFPGLSLRQAREKLGLTYREVEQSSYDLASRHGRPEFIIHISRLADIENGGVTPGVHKLYSLCAIYHLDLFEVCRWYDVPLDDLFRDGNCAAAPKTHKAAPPRSVRVPSHFDPGFDPRRTAYLTRMVENWTQLEGVMLDGQVQGRYCYGYVGLEDRWMEPLLRPGTLLLLDSTRQKIHNSGWRNEFERPIYFVDVRSGYHCCWCLLERNRMILQPYPLSPCAPEARRFPDEVEVIGQVIGMAMRLIPD